MNNKQDWLSHRLAEENRSAELDDVNMGQAYQQEKALQQALSNIGKHPVPSHSMQVMMTKAKWKHRIQNWMPTTLAYGAGLSTAFALMVVFNLPFHPSDEMRQIEPSLSVQHVVHYTAPQQDQTVLNTMVALESTEDVPWALVTVHLPKGVELDEFPGQSTVQFDTPLFKGQNQLPLKLVRTEKETAGEVEIQIDADQSPQLFKIPVQVAYQDLI